MTWNYRLEKFLASGVVALLLLTSGAHAQIVQLVVGTSHVTSSGGGTFTSVQTVTGFTGGSATTANR